MQNSKMKVYTFAIISIFLGILETNAEGDCPPNWTRFGNSCYLIHAKELTWRQAATECRAYDGGHLVIIDDYDENLFIIKLLYKHRVRGDVWFDGSDRRLEGTWVWVDTGVKMTDDSFQNWGPSEPNNSGMKEDCLSIWFCDDCDNQWNDLPCEREAVSVCEKPSKYAIVG